MPDALLIRPAAPDDLVAINDIYNHYVRTCTCTYQTVDSTLEERRQWLAARGPQHPAYVGVQNGEVVAWHSLTHFKPREAYARTVENSIYVRHSLLGKGLGRAMMEHQMGVAQALNHHAILAVISADQTPSIRLHTDFGFTQVGLMKEVGHKFGRWLNVALYQKVLDNA